MRSCRRGSWSEPTAVGLLSSGGHRRWTCSTTGPCGWNSVLEGIMSGVSMLGWLLYAEHRMNKVLMVEDLRIAVEMVGWQQGLVRTDELEAKVRLVMESQTGRELRERVSVHQKGDAMAWSNGGSSWSAFERFLSDMNCRCGAAAGQSMCP
ncbi:anthocyanidin 5,3-O-glucosyltransferase-like [Triticum dicoccoides]|uniref:anthocyanidin 5,3-O-glucosyltransferase-like n=1 Tax=Triticum dicoccoides TaxID=85692 RepID=UPI0018912F04|nr:anthocyanidin 5,3-O-glucosyltransferase-like [Triticum dicoccoides]